MWCDDCQNTGEKDCFCGGDLCICMNYGTYECTTCHGECGDDGDELHDEQDYGDE